MKRRLKVNGALIVLAIVLSAIFPHVFFRRVQVASGDEFIEIFGIALIILGQIFRASARGYKSENSQGGNALIQGGPYTLVRNPMYLGILLIGLGIVMVLFNWWAVIIFLGVFIARYLLLIFKEEKKLLTVFGQVYRGYLVRVPRIIPSLVSVLQKDIAEYLPLKWPWLKREMGSILAVLFIVLLLEGWEDLTSLGLKIYLQETALSFNVIVVFICLVVYLIRKTNKLQKYASNQSKNTL